MNALVSASLAPVTYFVRDADGDDTNDGLSQERAFKTAQAAWDKIPDVVNHEVKVRCGVHSGAGYAFPVLSMKLINSRIILVGDGAGTGDGFTVVFATEEAAAGTTGVRVVKTGGSLTINAHRGQTVELPDGQRRQITSNDADGFNFSQSFNPAPEATDDYRVVTCAVHFEIPPTGDDVQYVNGLGVRNEGGRLNIEYPGVHFAQFRINYDASLAFPTIAFGGCTMYWSGIEVDGSPISGSWFRVSDAVVFMGQDDPNGSLYKAPVAAGLATTDKEWLGWGLAELASGETLLVAAQEGALVWGCLIASGLSAPAGRYKLSGFLYGMTGFSFPTVGFQSGGEFQNGGSNGTLKIEAADALNCIEMRNGKVFLSDNVDMQADSGTLIWAINESRVYLGSRNEGPPTGTSTTGKVLDVKSGTAALFRGTTDPTWTGNGGVADHAVEGATAVATDFTVVGDVLTSANLTKIERSD
jgi:hypothetical protein